MWLPAKPLPTLVPLQALHLLCQEEFFNAKLRLYLCPSQNLSCTAHWISKKTQPPHLLLTCILHFSMRGGEGPLHLLFPLLEYSCLRSPPAQRRQPCHLSVGTVLYVLGSPIFPSGCEGEGKLGVALESLQGLRDLT